MRRIGLPFAKDTVTLFCRHVTRDADGRSSVEIVRRVLKGCLWTRSTGQNRDKNISVDTGETVLKIPRDSDYLPPDVWAKLLDTSEYFSIAPGDICVPGEVVSDVGASLSDIREMYRDAGAMTVTNVKDNA